MKSHWMPSKGERYIERGMILSCEHLSEDKGLFLFAHRFNNFNAVKKPHSNSVRVTFTGEQQSFCIAEIDIGNKIPKIIELDITNLQGKTTTFSYVATPLSGENFYLLSQQYPDTPKDKEILYENNETSFGFQVYHPARSIEIAKAVHRFLLMTEIPYRDLMPAKAEILRNLNLSYVNQPPHLYNLSPEEEFEFLFGLEMILNKPSLKNSRKHKFPFLKIKL